MTYEQALKFLQVNRREMVRKPEFYNETMIAVNGKAIEAIEKQIPKKPKIIKAEPIDIYKCPICTNYVGSSYCGICGQRLDWEETK